MKTFLTNITPVFIYHVLFIHGRLVLNLYWFVQKLVGCFLHFILSVWIAHTASEISHFSVVSHFLFSCRWFMFYVFTTRRRNIIE
ncbi:uncharacterized protein M6B38_146550 [Iris pallida]|uniref:Uncharacterized protein n=1 Tax=Iris pallida TaxID=29817 RepID=A0AAX6F9H5_IRIPA|nr:uncharacterized protein M6B38_146550 [Iris pallida]